MRAEFATTELYFLPPCPSKSTSNTNELGNLIVFENRYVSTVSAKIEAAAIQALTCNRNPYVCCHTPLPKEESRRGQLLTLRKLPIP